MAGGRSLNRQMPGDMRISVGGIIQQAHIGQDYSVHAETRGAVYRPLPLLPTIWLRVGIDGTENSRAPEVGVFNAFSCAFIIEVQSGKLTGVGAVFKTEIHGVGAVINGGFQGREAAGRAHKFHGFLRLGLTASTISDTSPGYLDLCQQDTPSLLNTSVVVLYAALRMPQLIDNYQNLNMQKHKLTCP